jgi:hypothetical protein
LVPRLAGSNPAEHDGFLRAIQNRSMTYFGEKVKPPVHVVIFCSMLKNPVEYKRYFVGKIHDHFSTSSPASLLGISDGYSSRALVVDQE